MSASVIGFDFHCHVDLHHDPVAIVDRCAQERIITIAVTNTPRAWPQNLEWANRNGYVHAAVGLHPELANPRRDEWGLMAEQIGMSRLIGEVGLDGRARHRKSYDWQKHIFGSVLSIAQDIGGKVLSIHSRAASDDVVGMIEKLTHPDRIQCILHWFSGSISEARRGVEAGCFFSVNAAMLRSSKGLRLVRNLPASRLLTETDSPFTSVGRRKSMPWDVRETATNLARACGLSASDLDPILLSNAEGILAFAGVELIGAE